MRAFEMYLPPGWARIDMVHDPDESIGRFLASVVRSAPPTRQPVMRALLEDRVGPRLREVADKGVACLLVPLDVSSVDPVRPIVSVRPLDAGGQDPLLVLQAVAGTDESARLVDVPGLVAVRTDRMTEASTEVMAQAQGAYEAVLAVPGVPHIRVPEGVVDPGMRLLSTEIRYLIGDPGDAERWVDIQFSVDCPSTAEAKDSADQAAETFDAIVRTFRWVS